jgi:hypothetical protein
LAPYRKTCGISGQGKGRLSYMTERSEREILITGFGGQGIIMTGNILGMAAALYDNKHATFTQSYGPEARGGSCSAQVIISDEEILFPCVEKPQVLVCMSQEGYMKKPGFPPDRRTVDLGYRFGAD